MLARILAVALNAYREAVRARVLYGLLGVALATTAYSLVVATLSLHQEQRVVADLGTASTSLYAIVVAIVLGATSLHRELELKTVFPILTRRLRRHEYVLGKYLGILGTLAVFVAIDAGAVLAVLSFEAGAGAKAGIAGVVLLAVLGVALWRAKRTRIFVLIPWSIALLLTMAVLADKAPDERRMVLASSLLTIGEVAIVSAVATLFSSFSSPFLTALLTLAVFALGRSADSLAHIPPRFFGNEVHLFAAGLARVVPNLHIYVPARTLLMGQVPESPVWPFVFTGEIHALFYATLLLTLSALIFNKRDFE